MPLTTDDVIEIQQLYSRYNTAIDTGDGATFGGLFVPEGVFNPLHALRGPGRDSEFAVKTHEAMPLMRHNATNIVVDGDDDHATGSAFLLGYIAGSSWLQQITMVATRTSHEDRWTAGASPSASTTLTPEPSGRP